MRVAVAVVAFAYRGKVVEQAATEEVFSRPRHEYTRRLLEAIPGSR